MTDYRELACEGREKLAALDPYGPHGDEYPAAVAFACNNLEVLLDAADRVESLTAELDEARECAGDWKTVADARERRERTALLTMGIEPTDVQDADLVESVKRLRAERDAARAELAELRMSRAELADEAQKLRDWRDGEQRENDRLATIGAVTPCSCSAQRNRAITAEAERDQAKAELADVWRTDVPSLRAKCDAARAELDAAYKWGRERRDEVNAIEAALGVCGCQESGVQAAQRVVAERDAARAELAEALAAIAGGPGESLSVHNGWIVEAANQCTCYGGGPYGHQPGCGYEPVVKLADIGEMRTERDAAQAAVARVEAQLPELLEIANATQDVSWAEGIEQAVEVVRRALQGEQS